MLFKLSLKNLKKSLKDYTIYFFTLILGVCIFYVFNSMETQTVMLKVSEDTREIIQLMNSLLSGVSVFVSFILGFLIIYASQFLMKRRKKEFGIYMTLGMGKRKISSILLLETLFIGLFSLIVGLGLGVGVSQIMSVIVANMFEADMSEFTFVFSEAAMIKTVLYFGIMYLLVMIFNVIAVNKCKLIDLLQAAKKSEQLKTKNSILCTIVFLISIVLLGFAYYKVTIGVNGLGYQMLLLCITFGIVGTYLFIWSFSGFILKLLQKSKRVYLKNLNLFISRQVSSKINTTVFSMTTISIMLFLTICILSSALSLKSSVTADLKELTPVDFQAEKTWNQTTNRFGGPLTDAQIADSKISVSASLEKLGLNLEDTFQDTLEFDVYQVDTVSLRDTLGDHISKATAKFPMMNFDVLETVMRVSDYNRLAELYGKPTYELNSGEYLILADFDGTMELRNNALKTNPLITINGKQYHSKYETCQKGFLDIGANHSNTGIIIVPDQAVTQEQKWKNYLVANYQAKTKEEKEAIESQIRALEHHTSAGEITVNATTKMAVYEASVGLGAIVTFIGIYLGIIFLISSAAILALKELSESADNKERYIILRRIGVDEKQLEHSLLIQIALFFFFPLLIAIVHSIFGIMFANNILITFGNEKLLASILLTSGFLILIYGGYFLITYYSSKNILKEE